MVKINRKKEVAGKWKIIFGLIAFVLTGLGLFVSTIRNEGSSGKILILFLISIFYIASLIDHYKDLINIYKNKSVNKNKHYVIITTFISVVVTWYLNHKLNYGAVISNGIVGVIAVLLLPKDLSGIAFTSSFVGMSSLDIIPNAGVAAIGGIIVGLIVIATGEIYAGIGGKGGTTAALSTFVTKFIVGLFN